MAKPTIHWQNEDTASQALIGPMMDDMGAKGEITRAAVKAYCNRLINEEQWTMGDLQMAATCFLEGYNIGFNACR